MYIAVFVLSVLAVPGVYYLVTVILSAVSDGEGYFLTLSGDGKSREELLLLLGRATMYLEGRRGLRRSPLVLFSVLPTPAMQTFLTDYGVSYCVLFWPNAVENTIEM